MISFTGAGNGCVRKYKTETSRGQDTTAWTHQAQKHITPAVYLHLPMPSVQLGTQKLSAETEEYIDYRNSLKQPDQLKYRTLLLIQKRENLRQGLYFST